MSSYSLIKSIHTGFWCHQLVLRLNQTIKLSFLNCTKFHSSYISLTILTQHKTYSWLCQFSRIKPFGLLIFSVRTSRTCKERSKKDFWSSAEGRTLLTFNCSSHCSLVLSTWWSSRYGNVWTTDTPEGPQELLNKQCRWLLSCWYSKNFDAAYACSPAVQQPNIRHWIWSISLYQNRNSPPYFFTHMYSEYKYFDQF